MGRSPCCDQEAGVKKGPWTPEEDKLLVDYINKNGHGSWRRLPKLAGLNRCGKSCRLRWTNYLRPDIKRGKFTEEEEKLIIHLHSAMGNKWSSIATKLPGRTDNEIKNYWNTHLRKKLLNMGIDPVTHRPRTDLLNLSSGSIPNLLLNLANHTFPAAWVGGDINALKLQADAAKFQLLQGLLRALTTSPTGVDLMALLAATGGLPTQPAAAAGVDQLLGATRLHQYDGLLNLPALTTVPAVTTSQGMSSAFAGLLNGFGPGSSSLAGDGLSSSTTDQLGASGSNMTAAMAPPLVAAADECNNANGGGATPCEETPASSPFEGLESLNLDDLNSDSWKDLLDQMSWFNPNEM